MDQQDDSSNYIANKEIHNSNISGYELQEKPPSDIEQVSSREAEKADAIRRACDQRDLDALVSYATSEGGFLQDELRKLACE